jgi:hypothetical protein
MIGLMEVWKMNSALVKSFDNLMHQQNKMDNKAYIFIGFLTLIFNFVNKDWQSINVITWLLVVIAIPLVISLIPVANSLAVKLMIAFINAKAQKKLNIFYYIDICQLEQDDFIELFKREYKEQSLTKYDEKLIEQIIINAKILKIKVFWHNISQISALIAIIVFIVYLIKY